MKLFSSILDNLKSNNTLDMKTVQDRRYVGSSWPSYAYGTYNKKKIVLIFVIAFFAIIFGLLIGVMGWNWIASYQERHLPDDDPSRIESMWTGASITVPSDLAEYMKDCSYYETNVWFHMNPEEQSDGSIVFMPESKYAFYDFIMAMRGEMDRLFHDAEGSYGFLKCEISNNYHDLTIVTSARKGSLVNQNEGMKLLQHMKIHSLFYDMSLETSSVYVYFQPDGSDTVILQLKL